MAKRPYIVTELATGAQRLVEAGSQSQALNHAAQDAYAVKTATSKEVMDLMKRGIRPEEAGPAPAPAPE